jgi:hypothetical protein
MAPPDPILFVRQVAPPISFLFDFLESVREENMPHVTFLFARQVAPLMSFLFDFLESVREENMLVIIIYFLPVGVSGD